MKKIFNKISLLFVFIFVVSLTLVGCAPKENPEETLNKYYENIKSGNAEEAYEALCEQSKKDFTEEDFTKWRNTEKEVCELKETKIEKVNEFKGSLENIEFKNIVEFNATEKVKDLYENKEVEQKHKMYVVNDNGKWKIYLNKKLIKQLTSNDLTQLARMYMYGTGNKTKDLNKAISLLEEAIKLNPNNEEAKSALPYLKASGH
ncbi:DUF4878 domain-containing protein [Clostridium sporogenes]|uniref:NTF2-like N-terminal transpeptidase domain-containing protein n=1 Tax=Clostridium sporogenes TaxID=1509 RepID=UPI0013CFBC5A|nr:NTF2-like N-terminal transpeptidase domain-containing protein [Clostridium sporogenes]MDU5116923.1 DUF4878 domain-containing protein [Clostridium botulinum]NFG96859.1 DUF4878 domain-containing protein [Clostridium sporogenes]NFH33219.1 DUF4878 domain-containing protein [Clostridium sporogenes]NFL20196.1 DUF4878 domain-containing protein [Clostridium sporogenes]NFN71790.1 DUF4878 domain-containing protein [Clostridium sporogenes]